MSNTDEIRWQQRLDSFRKALAQLEAACELDEYSDLERAGLVQTFEFSFELGWKALKDLLFYEGYDEKTPRDVLRRAYEVGYIDETDTEIGLDALDKRNLLSHTYNEETAQEALLLIKEQYAPMLRRVRDKLVERQSNS